ncbi:MULTISPECIES: hypothetical protein [unclassified Bradyrhizobium]
MLFYPKFDSARGRLAAQCAKERISSKLSRTRCGRNEDTAERGGIDPSLGPLSGPFTSGDKDNPSLSPMGEMK